MVFLYVLRMCDGVWSVPVTEYQASEQLLFFFFKEKTAYDMRISDWSSDVCSSDLPRHRRVAPDVHTVRSAQQLDGLHLLGRMNTCDGSAKIGSASCRERVCQYV